MQKKKKSQQSTAQRNRKYGLALAIPRATELTNYPKSKGMQNNPKDDQAQNLTTGLNVLSDWWHLILPTKQWARTSIIVPVLQMRNLSSEITQVVEEDLRPGLSDFRILSQPLYLLFLS